MIKQKTVITCAVTGAVTSLDQTPYLPITPEQIATSALEAAEAGAAIVHLHVRDIETGKASMKLELYQETVYRIKLLRPDLLINLTTGPGASGSVKDFSFIKTAEQRVKHILTIKPDICSLDLNTMNRGPNGITINTINIAKEMAAAVREVGCKPELEIFDSGDYHIAQQLIKEGVIENPPLWQFALGVKLG